MAMEGFYNGCLKATRKRYEKLLVTPRSRAGKIDIELMEIYENIGKSVGYGELDKKVGENLIKEFKKIDFNGLAKARAEIKKQERIAKKEAKKKAGK